jgi:transposase-like protein
MAVIPDFKSATLLGFLKENVVLGSTVYTDGLKSFAGLQQAGFQHVARPQPLRIDLRKAAFQTLLGLGTGRKPTAYQQIRGGTDLFGRSNQDPISTY